MPVTNAASRLVSKDCVITPPYIAKRRDPLLYPRPRAWVNHRSRRTPRYLAAGALTIVSPAPSDYLAGKNSAPLRIHLVHPGGARRNNRVRQHG